MLVEVSSFCEMLVDIGKSRLRCILNHLGHSKILKPPRHGITKKLSFLSCKARGKNWWQNAQEKCRRPRQQMSTWAMLTLTVQ